MNSQRDGEDTEVSDEVKASISTRMEGVGRDGVWTDSVQTLPTSSVSLRSGLPTRVLESGESQFLPSFIFYCSDGLLNVEKKKKIPVILCNLHLKQTFIRRKTKNLVTNRSLESKRNDTPGPVKLGTSSGKSLM